MSRIPMDGFLSLMSLQDPPVITQSGWLEHGPFAAWLIEATAPDLLVELGTHWGYSFFAFCEAVKTLGLPTKCVAVDTWEGDEHAGFYADEVYDFVNSRAAADYSEMATLKRMRFDEALGDVEDGSIDLLHIDGRHRYEDAAEDFNSYLPKVSSRGVVVMHDIVERGHGFGVWRHWEDVKRDYPTFEFHHGHGLGVVAVGPDAPAAIRRLTALPQDSAEAELVRRTYHKLGQMISAGAAAEEGVRHEDALVSAVRQAEGRLTAMTATVRRLEGEVRSGQQLSARRLGGLVRARLRTVGDRLLSASAPDEPTVNRLRDLFDADYYAEQHPELVAGQATFEHYLAHGWPVDESPTPLFDRDWYLAVNPDIREVGMPALAHYLAHGDLEGRDPNAVFDSSWYREQHADDFEPGDLALCRYATVGQRLRHDPSPAFATRWYLERYPDVAEGGRNALSDYLTHGALRGRNPHPNFDTSWYVARYTAVCRDGTNPLVHYLTFGRDEGRQTTATGAHLSGS